MKSHIEFVICPACDSVEEATIMHLPFKWVYEHLCKNCGYLIYDKDWNSRGKMIHDDMMSIMQKIKTSNEKLVVITDPPYGVRKEEGWDDAQMFKKQIKGWLNECLRVTEFTLVWFCANRMFPYIFSSIKPEQFLREHHWKKPKGSQFAGASNNNIWYSTEPILVLTKDRDKTVRNYDREVGYNYDDLEYDTIAKAKHGHPTTKPVNLMAQLILHYTLPHDTILDPFGGSGSTVEAAIKCGRKFIYIEQSPVPGKPVTDLNGDNPDHFGRAKQRIYDALSQKDLFMQGG